MAKGTIGLGQYHGKVGGMVMRVVNGKQVMQIYQPTVKNPDTQAQRVQREGMRMLGKVGGSAKHILKNTYSGRYSMAQFIGRAIKRTTGALDYTGSPLNPNFSLEFNWAGMPWGKGDGETTLTVTTVGQLAVGSHLQLNFTGGAVSGLSSGQMEKIIIAYCPDLSEAVWNRTSTPSSDSGTITVPSRWDGMECHVWVVGKGYLETPATEALDQDNPRLPFVTTDAKYVGMIEVS